MLPVLCSTRRSPVASWGCSTESASDWAQSRNSAARHSLCVQHWRVLLSTILCSFSFSVQSHTEMSFLPLQISVPRREPGVETCQMAALHKPNYLGNFCERRRIVIQVFCVAWKSG